MPTIEKATDNCLLGEGPHWDASTQSLFFVDIPGKTLVKYSHKTKIVTRAQVEKQPSFIIPIEGKPNHFVISLDNDLTVISWDGESDKISIIEKLATANDPEKFNDAKCDSSGRLWAGTHIIDVTDFRKTEPLGILYTLDATRHLKGQIKGIRVANGLAFNDKTKKMFYIDSLTRAVDRYDFDINSGTATNKQTWFTLDKFSIPGDPDGMTIDTDGNLWVAIFGGNRVLKVDGNQQETLLDTISIPADQVSSVTFGGPDLDELYVTTGAMEWEGVKLKQAANGATFKVTGTGAKGFPGVSFKLG